MSDVRKIGKDAEGPRLPEGGSARYGRGKTLHDKTDRMAQEAFKRRPANEREFRSRPDRVGIYLQRFLDSYRFDTFTEALLAKAGGKYDYLKDVPIPLREEDREKFASENGLPINIIGENMARIIGIDPKFKYADVYIRFLEQLLGRKAQDFFNKEAKKEAAKGEFEAALIHFRAALTLAPEDLQAMYGYARVCRDLYSQEDKTADYVGKFKAESLDYFEMVTELHPDYAQGWYYLGYLYLNMGLYAKAKIAWERFLPITRTNADRREIKERLDQIKSPVEIERGVNAILSGRWQEGIDILEPFTDSVFSDWWPMHYYLGEAYLAMGRDEDSEQEFIKTLRINATNIETMQRLVEIYDARGDAKNAKKYRDKIALLAVE
jgi:tetratricopeptide (TPR) repeat protein